MRKDMNRDILERAFPTRSSATARVPSGQTFSYVEGAEYVRRLNEAFEAEWTFEIIEHHVARHRGRGGGQASRPRRDQDGLRRVGHHREPRRAR